VKTTSQSNSNLVQARFLADLALIQQDTAPIDLSIGAAILGTVNSGCIIVKNAPGLVVEKMVDLVKKYGVRVSLRDGGLLIDFSTANEMTREEFFK